VQRDGLPGGITAGSATFRATDASNQTTDCVIAWVIEAVSTETHRRICAHVFTWVSYIYLVQLGLGLAARGAPLLCASTRSPGVQRCGEHSSASSELTLPPALWHRAQDTTPPTIQGCPADSEVQICPGNTYTYQFDRPTASGDAGKRGDRLSTTVTVGSRS
jgi:hypothetical protein